MAIPETGWRWRRPFSVILAIAANASESSEPATMDGYMAGKMAKFAARYLSDPEQREKRLTKDVSD
jgi:hypothetical protein